jgi:hypothetical protein
MDYNALKDIFVKLGARNPDDWARSQINDGTPQVARFLFLRQAWRLVISENDEHWVQAGAKVDSAAPGGALGSALRRVLAQGVSEVDLTTIVRVMQWRLLSGLCYLIDDPGDVEDEVRNIAWSLFQISESGEPVAVIGGLHESLLEAEPTGQEMRQE